MRTLTTLFSLCAAVLLLSACATSPDTYQRSTLRQQILISYDALYEEKRGAFGTIWTIGLHPGTYTPELEGEGGVFFRGPERCVVHQPGDKTSPTVSAAGVFSNREGGIWIPSSKVMAPRVYFYEDYDYETASKGGGPVIVGILAFEKGKITRLQPSTDPEFLKALEPKALE